MGLVGGGSVINGAYPIYEFTAMDSSRLSPALWLQLERDAGEYGAGQLMRLLIY